jgi:hypothetical protein
MFALLTSHPSISMTRRTNYWRYIDQKFGDLSEDRNLEACLDVMRRYKRMVAIGLDWDRVEADFRKGPATYGHLYEVIQGQQAAAEGKSRWGDKSLMNERYADRIFQSFPDARIIHMIRDPRDRYASVLARWKSRRGGVGAGMGEWFESVQYAESNLVHRPEQCIVMRYEDLVAEPEAAMRRICDFIGEPFAEEMMTMSGAERFRQEGANSSYGRRPMGAISTSSIGKYTNVLSTKQVRYIEKLARNEMQRHRYEASVQGTGGFDALLFYGAVLPFEELRRRAWQARGAWHAARAKSVPGYRFVDTGTADDH